MRNCSSCKTSKPSSEFYPRSSRPGKLSAECKSCFKNRMSYRHQEHKLILVKEFGGKCSSCGYSKELRILNFHHIDPTTKSFGISKKASANLDILRQEASKCILLCPNCHSEHHLGSLGFEPRTLILKV